MMHTAEMTRRLKAAEPNKVELGEEGILVRKGEGEVC